MCQEWHEGAKGDFFGTNRHFSLMRSKRVLWLQRKRKKREREREGERGTFAFLLNFDAPSIETIKEEKTREVSMLYPRERKLRRIVGEKN